MRRRRAKPRRSGRCGTSPSTSSPASRSGSSAATAPARRRCCGWSPASSARPSGRVEVGGSVGSLLELGAGFHPDFTGRENVYLSGSIYGLKRRYVRERLDEIVAFAELERFIDLPVRTYSSGMYMRLGFAVAMHIDADILLLDEVFAVGDEAFQRKCVDKIFEFRARGGTIVFVSHWRRPVERLCERAVLLTQGGVEYDGETQEAIRATTRCWRPRRAPRSVGAGLREWGTGEVRVADVGSKAPTASSATSSSPASRLPAARGRAPVPPPRLSLELRDARAACSVRASRISASSAGTGARDRELRFAIDRLPLAKGASSSAWR